MAHTTDALEAFVENVRDVYSRIIAQTLGDDDGWTRIGDALTELREASAVESGE